MKLYRVINKATGLFIRDDFAFDEATEIGLDVSPAQGFYYPKWNGTEWVEGGIAPEPQPTEPTIDELKQQLADTDYKIIKCYEYQLAGLELPYDIQALHTERQAIRDKIAKLEVR